MVCFHIKITIIIVCGIIIPLCEGFLGTIVMDHHLVSTNERIIFLIDTYCEMFTEWANQKTRITVVKECKHIYP